MMKFKKINFKKKPKKDVYQFELTLQTHDPGYEFRITL
jgi:hypothetical protein